VPRARSVGAADRIDPQLLAKFAPEFRVSTHAPHATEGTRLPSAILSPVDRKLYRRRQRRRAIIGWASLLVVVALVVVGVAANSGDHRSDGTTTAVGIFTASMTADEYDSIREGEEQAIVLGRLGNVGMSESEITEELLVLFPREPENSNCAFWFLSDAPEHLVRLCFSDSREVLLQKSVAAQGEDAVPRTLV
jgi:hypothetical protein